MLIGILAVLSIQETQNAYRVEVERCKSRNAMRQ